MLCEPRVAYSRVALTSTSQTAAHAELVKGEGRQGRRNGAPETRARRAASALVSEQARRMAIMRSGVGWTASISLSRTTASDATAYTFMSSRHTVKLASAHDQEASSSRSIMSRRSSTVANAQPAVTPRDATSTTTYTLATPAASARP